MDQSQLDILGFRPEAISDPVRRLKYCNAAPHRFPVHSVPVPNNFRLHRTYTAGQNNEQLTKLNAQAATVEEVINLVTNTPDVCFGEFVSWILRAEPKPVHYGNE